MFLLWVGDETYSVLEQISFVDEIIIRDNVWFLVECMVLATMLVLHLSSPHLEGFF
jgi:hypothetical protein